MGGTDADASVLTHLTRTGQRQYRVGLPSARGGRLPWPRWFAATSIPGILGSHRRPVLWRSKKSSDWVSLARRKRAGRFETNTIVPGSRNQRFESSFLHRRVSCELGSETATRSEADRPALSGRRQRAAAAKPAGRDRSSPSLGDQILALATDKTQQEIAAACKGLAQTMSASRLPGTSGLVGSRSATGNSTRGSSPASIRENATIGSTPPGQQ